MKEIWKVIKSNLTDSVTQLDKPSCAPIGKCSTVPSPAPLWAW